MLREDKVKYADICYITMVDSYDFQENEFDTAYPMKHWTNWIQTILNILGIDNDYNLCRSLFDINMKEFERFWQIETSRLPLQYKIDINLREDLHDNTMPLLEERHIVDAECPFCGITDCDCGSGY